MAHCALTRSSKLRSSAAKRGATRKTAMMSVRSAVIRLGSVVKTKELPPLGRRIDPLPKVFGATLEFLSRKLCVLYCQIWVGSSQFFEIITRGADVLPFLVSPLQGQGLLASSASRGSGT